MADMEALTPTQTSEKDSLDTQWELRCGVLYKAWVQVRYHRRRQRFFDLADKVTKSLTVALGASLLGRYFNAWLPWLAVSITTLGLFALVFGYGDRKQMHKELAESAATLVSDIEAVPAGELTAARVATWHSRYAQLCAKAPPPLKSLTLMCEAEQSAADGYPGHVRLPWCLRRWLADFKS